MTLPVWTFHDFLQALCAFRWVGLSTNAQMGGQEGKSEKPEQIKHKIADFFCSSSDDNAPARMVNFKISVLGRNVCFCFGLYVVIHCSQSTQGRQVLKKL